MQLSKRLQAVADLVTPGSRVADIGCDHAYISIYLITQNISPHVIAMDINKGPLEKARENIIRYNQEDRIEIRQSDGLNKLHPGEADTLLLAGMGGALTLKILSEQPEVLASVRELILQPQSELHLVRKALYGLGFFIVREHMLVEDGKYYVCMKAKAASLITDRQPYELTGKVHYYYGRFLLEQKDPILYKYLNKMRMQCENIYNTLIRFPTEQSLLRQEEIMEEIKMINGGLEYYKEAGNG